MWWSEDPNWWPFVLDRIVRCWYGPWSNMVINDEWMSQKVTTPKDKMIKNMINIVTSICDLLPMERARERENKKQASISLFSLAVVCGWICYRKPKKYYGVPLTSQVTVGSNCSNLIFLVDKEWLTPKTVLIHIYAVSEPQTKKQLRNHGRLLKSHIFFIITLEDSEVLHAHFGNVKERSTPQVRQRGYLLSLAALGAVLLFNASSSCWGWLELRILRFNWFGFYWQHTQKWQSSF